MNGHIHLGKQHQHDIPAASHHHDALIDEHRHSPEFHLFHLHVNDSYVDNNSPLGQDYQLPLTQHSAKYKPLPTDQLLLSEIPQPALKTHIQISKIKYIVDKYPSYEYFYSLARAPPSELVSA